jgi:hypothetical protein
MMTDEKFILTKDKEKARVRFLYQSLEEVTPVELHSPALGKTRKMINIPIYNEDAKCRQIWERSIFIYPTLEKIYAQYDNVPEYIFEIIRLGEPGDIHTKYDINCLGKIDVTI